MIKLIKAGQKLKYPTVHLQYKKVQSLSDMYSNSMLKYNREFPVHLNSSQLLVGRDKLL